MEIKYSGAVSKEDFLEQMSIIGKPIGKKMKMVSWKFLFILGSLFAFYGILRLVISHSDWEMYIIIGSVFLFLGYRIKKAFLDFWKNNEVLMEPRSGVISEEKIIIINKNSTTSFLLDELKSYGDSENQILLFVGDNTCINFPKHFFHDEVEWGKFKNFVAKKLKHSHSIKAKSKLQMFAMAMIFIGLASLIYSELKLLFN